MIDPNLAGMVGHRLVIDAGNSRTKWALVRTDGSWQQLGAFSHNNPLDDTQSDLTAHREQLQWDDFPTPIDIWISNAAGHDVAARLSAMLDARWPSIKRTTIVSRHSQCGVINGYSEPAQLGTDRWAGMIGARAAYPGEHLLIVTLGTATTIEALRADGIFIGGFIAPGWSLMMRSLGEHTAQLPTLTLASARSVLAGKGDLDFGTDTPASLCAGCALAQTGLIKHAYLTWRVELGDAPIRMVLGGGGGDALAAALTVPYTRHDHLILSGLALIAQDEVTVHKHGT
ncbi:type III pantothenate kinase [Candidatus Vallotia cooleyia]|uniref:type III pantothenate kinase n=1 Tax=Candidatus Vallotiella adelgis TaxID=1177211 RepID=UPI001D00B056|nr:type III pantothenate kinase [Candidatus Vallotia cooleyia]UDG82552.1 Type III pantothenate kinase [Candidatus Vallotia cooleyia]